MAEALRIGLLGFGNIGSAVVRLLQENGDLINGRCPRPLQLRFVADIDLSRPRKVKVSERLLTDDSEVVVRHPEVDVVVELIGGVEPARTLVEAALRNGKHVVTANKAMLASHGADLLALARRNNVALLFEAAVGGGVPVIRTLCRSLAANRITRIEGILNGTCNYILTQMAEAEMVYDEALAQAQELGYAEADPTADVESIDAAQKIAILASLAFGFDIRYGDVSREGITRITLQDLHSARQMGCVVRQLAVAELRNGDEVAVYVRPALLPREHPLASVGSVLNGIVIEGEPIEMIYLEGPGAGPGPTSSAVVSDLMAVSALDRDQPPHTSFLKVEPGRKPSSIATQCECDGYWMRILSCESSEALADLARILARSGVPVEGISQKIWMEDDSGETIAIEVATCEVAEENVRRAAQEIAAAEWSTAEQAVLVLPRYR